MTIALTREQHCALAFIGVDSFKALQRLNRLPILPAEVRAAKGFGPFETLALITALEFREQHRQAHERAAAIASQLATILPMWPDIVKASTKSPIEEILFGRVESIGDKPASVAVCGRLGEIAEDYPSTAKLVVLSISRIVAVMRNRARDLKIDLGEFWSMPVPLPAPTKTAKRKARPQSKSIEKPRRR
jgi:hypothetical protein